MHITDDPILMQSMILSGILFSIGFSGILMRRNLLIMLMCIELMLSAVNLAFVSFSRANASVDGQLAVFFIITVAAAEAGVGLGLLIALFRNLKEVGTIHLNKLKG